VLRLVSSSPRVAVRIHQNFLAADRDWRTLRAGLRIVRSLAREPALRGFVERETSPGPLCVTDSEMDAHIRATTVTANHPLGTCKMGVDSDSSAVVDPELRVYGTSGLRVVDASVMPDLVGGNIVAAVYMIAERAVDLIRGSARQ
jgi:4-pyridoxate dehydrogenase